MGEALILGVDLGTSGCKALVIDGRGQVVARAVSEYPLYTPWFGWAEQDPADWWAGTVSSIRQVINQIDPSCLIAMGLSGQMHGLVPLDAGHRVLRRAILWHDQRTKEQCEEIVRLVGGEAKLLELTNNSMLPGYTAPKILWLREKEPAIYERVRIFINPKDFLRLMLTGEVATEVSDASGTGLFNVRERAWSAEVLSALAISEEQLPRCYESAAITGRINDAASEATGLPKGLPVVGGGGDAVIQTTGTGLVRRGILGTTIGTAGIAAMGLQAFVPNVGGRLQVFCNNAPGMWHVMGVTLSAGGALQWFKNALCEGQREKAESAKGDVYEIIEAQAKAAPPGSKGLLFLPYLIGERCPFADPNARGAFIGLTLRHSHADLTRSVFEGVVFSLRHVFDVMRSLDRGMVVSEIRTSGGGAVSDLWRQIQADVFQLPVKTVSGSKEGGAYGACLVAGVGCGLWHDIEEAVETLTVETENLPNPLLRNLYEDLYKVYSGLYTALKPSFDAMASSSFC